MKMGNKLIIVSGCCGAGKETTGRLLLSALEPSAWIDIKSLGRISPWGYEEKLILLSIENAADLADNFFRAGYCQVIFSGGIHSQEELGTLMSLIHTDCRVIYVWLDVDKMIRDKRRIARARDPADNPEHLDYIDSLIKDPGKLLIPNGAYYRIQIDVETPHEALGNVLETLAEEGLALKGVNSS
jgi:hypothetical protein